jgi:hypothetical protein
MRRWDGIRNGVGLANRYLQADQLAPEIETQNCCFAKGTLYKGNVL